MAGAAVQVAGLRDTVRNLERLGAEASDLRDVFFRVGALVSGRAADLAPYRTGALAGSVRPTRGKNRATIRAGTARAPYARYIEFGPRPQPFMRPAAADSADEATALVDRGLTAILSRLNLT